MHVIKPLSAYARLLRLDKPIGIFLLLWPTLWGLWIASQGIPDQSILWVFVTGCILMRSAGCAINDYADRHFDKHVARTKHRPLATGEVTPRETIFLFVFICGIAFLLVLTLNIFTILLSLIGLILAIIYPFTKRFTYFPQVLLGVIFGGWGVLMAFAAVTNSLPPIAYLLFSLSALWPIAYDTMYAMVDREEDRLLNLKSTALLFDRYDRFIILGLQCTMILLLILLGQWQHFNYWFYLGVSMACGFIFYQQTLLATRDPKNYFKAFLNNHWVGFSIFTGIFLNYYFSV